MWIFKYKFKSKKRKWSESTHETHEVIKSTHNSVNWMLNIKTKKRKKNIEKGQ